MRVLRVIWSTVKIVCGAVVFALLVFRLWPDALFGSGASQADPYKFNPTDIVTISLAAATLVLAGVAVIVSLLAVVGYTALKESAANIAREAAAKVAEPCAKETAARVARIEVYKLFDQHQADASDNRTEAYGLDGAEANAIARAAGAGRTNQAL